MIELQRWETTTYNELKKYSFHDEKQLQRFIENGEDFDDLETLQQEILVDDDVAGIVYQDNKEIPNYIEIFYHNLSNGRETKLM